MRPLFVLITLVLVSTSRADLPLLSTDLLSKGMVKVPASELAKIKQRPCVFIHLWATWCDICIAEMEGLLKALAKEKRVTPYLINVDTEFVQKEVANKYMNNLRPPFPVYAKPDGGDDAYMKAVDSELTGALPYSALHHQGKRRMVWKGAVDLKTFSSDVAKACQ